MRNSIYQFLSDNPSIGIPVCFLGGFTIVCSIVLVSSSWLKDRAFKRGGFKAEDKSMARIRRVVAVAVYPVFVILWALGIFAIYLVVIGLPRPVSLTDYAVLIIGGLCISSLIGWMMTKCLAMADYVINYVVEYRTEMGN